MFVKCIYGERDREREREKGRENTESYLVIEISRDRKKNIVIGT